MRRQAKHCPFLNRGDPQCAEHLALHSLSYVFDHCLGSYSRCKVYFQKIVSRRVRQSEARAVLTVGGKRLTPQAASDR